MNNLILGADPEVFISKNGKIVSAENKLEGKKSSPLRIDNDIWIHEDNALGEFGFTPVDNPQDLESTINRAIYLIEEKIGDEFNIDLRGSGKIDEDELTDQTLSSGCSPEFDCFSLEESDPPDLSNTLLRSAGGHLHIGYDSQVGDRSLEYQNRIRVGLCRLLDLYLLIPSMFVEDKTDIQRLSLFGDPGKMRFKDYGLEYRSLSNFWLRNKINIYGIFKRTQEALDHMTSVILGGGDPLYPLEEYELKVIRSIAEERDYIEGEKILQKYDIEHIKELQDQE